jgi:hypothetical protein
MQRSQFVTNQGFLPFKFVLCAFLVRKLNLFNTYKTLSRSNIFLGIIYLWYKINFSFLYPGIYRIHPKGPQSKKAISIIKQLPTMPKKILLLESVLYVLNKFN